MWSNDEDTSDKPKLRDILQNNGSVLLMKKMTEELFQMKGD